MYNGNGNRFVPIFNIQFTLVTDHSKINAFVYFNYGIIALKCSTTNSNDYSNYFSIECLAVLKTYGIPTLIHNLVTTKTKQAYY